MLILAAENGENRSRNLSTALSQAGFQQVDLFDITNDMPGFDAMSGYDAIVAYTHVRSDCAGGIGARLAMYADLGGTVVLGNYGFTLTTAFVGGIEGPAYSPLENRGGYGEVSGNLTLLAPDDPLFAGVGSVSYYHKGAFAQHDLSAGASLLATDGAGVNMIARSASGRIVAINLYPGDMPENSPGIYRLFANAATNGAGVVDPPAPVPEFPSAAPLAAFVAWSLPRLRHHARA